MAHTSGGGRKFLFAPALLGNRTRVYVAIGTGDDAFATQLLDFVRLVALRAP